MLRSSVTIGRVFGIPIKVHSSWFLVFVLITWSLAAGYFPQRYPHWDASLSWTVALATSLLFFASVLLHELAHSLVALDRGLPIHDIVLFVFGGVAQLTEEPEAPGVEFTMALVGPLTSFGLAVLFAITWVLTRLTNQPIAALSAYLARMNALMGAFNLIPGFPMDGGRVLRSLLWAASRNLERATRWATGVGQAVAYLLIIAGAFQVLRGHWDGLWLAFIGWFLENAAQTSYRQVAIKEFLMSHRVREMMDSECYPLSPDITVEALVRNYVMPLGRRCFPVISEGKTWGIVSLPLIQQVPQTHWSQVTARAVMVPLEDMHILSPDDGLWTALQKMRADRVDQLPVAEKGQFVGMLTHDAILAFIGQRGIIHI